MAIITISRGSYHNGRAVAEKLADKLGYECVSRDRIIDQLEDFHLPEIKLKRGLNDAFSLLDRFPNGKKRYITAMRAALLKKFCQGNIVYHGLSGHHYIKTISHVLKIRIVADLQNRVEAEMKRADISAEKARMLLKKDDEERRKWAMFLYDIDLFDSSLYNLVIRIGHFSEDDAVKILADASQLPLFQETPESKAELEDAALEAEVDQALFDFPTAQVHVKDRHVRVGLKLPEDQKEEIQQRIEGLLEPIEGIASQEFDIAPYY
ncbi:MAG: cytidylate kinase-like family protein [Desulfobacterales bacterium]|nr:cytidylate kinase-like family protein [Desulfobacterales bacterium]